MTHNPVDVLSLNPAEILRQIAVHEAGHAVVGSLLGFELIDVSVADVLTQHPAGDGWWQMGGARFEAPDEDVNQLAKQRPDEMAVVLLAGTAAEEVALRQHIRESWAGDLRIIRSSRGMIDESTPEEAARFIQTFVRPALDEAERLVRGRYEWIARVANELQLSRWLSAESVAAAQDP